MTNYEKFKSRIDEIWESGHDLTICNGEIRRCDDINCKECDFDNNLSCSMQMAQWLVAEYKEPEFDWSKVEVDTPILVRQREDEEWRKRYFAKYKNGTVYAWDGGCTSWTADDTAYWQFAKLAEEE